MRNVFDASINEKSTIEYPNFLMSILKSPTPDKLIEKPSYFRKSRSKFDSLAKLHQKTVFLNRKFT